MFNESGQQDRRFWSVAPRDPVSALIASVVDAIGSLGTAAGTGLAAGAADIGAGTSLAGAGLGALGGTTAAGLGSAALGAGLGDITGGALASGLLGTGLGAGEIGAGTSLAGAGLGDLAATVPGSLTPAATGLTAGASTLSGALPSLTAPAISGVGTGASAGASAAPASAAPSPSLSLGNPSPFSASLPNAGPVPVLSNTSSLATGSNAFGPTEALTTGGSMPLTTGGDAALTNTLQGVADSGVAGGPIQSGGLLSSIFGSGGSDIASLLKTYGSPLLTAGALGTDLLKGNQTLPGSSQLASEAAALQSQGNTLQSYLTNGTLPAGVQQQINQAAESAKAAIRSRFAQIGGDTSAMQQDLAAVDQQAATQGATIATQLLNSGVSETQLSAQLYETLLANATSQNAALGSALGNLAAASAAASAGTTLLKVA